MHVTHNHCNTTKKHRKQMSVSSGNPRPSFLAIGARGLVMSDQPKRLPPRPASSNHSNRRKALRAPERDASCSPESSSSSPKKGHSRGLERGQGNGRAKDPEPELLCPHGFVQRKKPSGAEGREVLWASKGYVNILTPVNL